MGNVEQDKEQKKKLQYVADTAVLSAAEKTLEKKPFNLSKKTTGEKYYDVTKFAVAEAFIVGVTAVTAYWALYSKRSAINIFGRMQDATKEIVSWITKKIGKEESKLRKNATIAGALALGTTATFHGGNAFAPVMKWFGNHKNSIVAYFNEKFGKPGEVEIGNERLKDAPKQTWGDIIKGRMMSWAIVFTSLTSAVFLFPNSKKNDKSHFGNFEEWVGRKVAGLSKNGKELSKISVYDVPRVEDLKKLYPHLAENSAYRFGKILAIDIYATAAAIFIWSIASEFSAKKRQKQEKGTEKKHDVTSTVDYPALSNSSFTENIKLRDSHADAITMQREAAETRPTQLGV